MLSIRSYRRLGSWLALFALALQIVVSFGHVHLDGINRLYRVPGVIAFKAQAQLPPAQQPSNDDSYCAICESIYLAANSFIPQAPALLVPFVSKPIKHFHRVAISLVPPRRTPFQSRAPPLG